GILAPRVAEQLAGLLIALALTARVHHHAHRTAPPAQEGLPLPLDAPATDSLACPVAFWRKLRQLVGGDLTEKTERMSRERSERIAAVGHRLDRDARQLLLRRLEQ